MTKKNNPVNQSEICSYSLPQIMLKGTSAGNPLRRLGSLTCPYTGIKIIPGKFVHPFEKKLQICENAGEYINLLSGYVLNMQKTEKSVYSILKDFALENPYCNLQDCLNYLYKGCLTRLKLEEFMVLDDVDAMTKKLSPQTALKIREKTTKCRSVILADNKEDTFKRKVFLNSLSEISPKENEKDLFERIKDRAIYLPTSGSSTNAFVVKYSRRTEKEIARRIFIASTGTIEHVTPDSEGGKNEIGNFILASANGNRYRENMPLYKYVQRFPSIPKYCQQYINEVIDAIHNGGLGGNELYPYLIKQRLIDESCGLITVSLSKYDYTEKEAKILQENYHLRKQFGC